MCFFPADQLQGEDSGLYVYIPSLDILGAEHFGLNALIQGLSADLFGWWGLGGLSVFVFSAFRFEGLGLQVQVVFLFKGFGSLRSSRSLPFRENNCSRIP